MPEIKKSNTQQNVLVIEDDQLLRGLLITKFTKEGFGAKGCVDAEHAFVELRQDKPDIVLLDLVLPGIDGFEILEKIKADKDLTDIPVLILSNLGQQEDIDRVISLGADDFLVKADNTLAEILKRVQKILSNYSAK